MVHRQTPSMSGFRAYSGGGARALIDKVDDSELMQAMNGQGMKGEGFSGSKDGKYKGPEAPQNYGFSSVVADATKGNDGQIEQCAEGFLSFLGGNRSLPVCAMMDDRRHRLKNLAKDAAKGAASIYGLKEWGQQYLNTEDGQYITGNLEKKNRMQLVQNKNGQKQQKQAGGGGAQQAQQAQQAQVIMGLRAFRAATGYLSIRSHSGVEFEIEEFEAPPMVAARAGNGAGPVAAGGQESQGKSKPTGQKTLHKEQTEVYVEQNGTDTVNRHGNAFASVKGGSDSTTHWEKDKKKSTQCTEDHVHIRFKENRIFNDKDGNWWTTPCLVKKDEYCKEG